MGRHTRIGLKGRPQGQCLACCETARMVLHPTLLAEGYADGWPGLTKPAYESTSAMLAGTTRTRTRAVSAQRSEARKPARHRLTGSCFDPETAGAAGVSAQTLPRIMNEMTSE